MPEGVGVQVPPDVPIIKIRGAIMNEEIQLDEPIVSKPSRAERIKRSIFARRRRKEVKLQKEMHSYKLEKEARERLEAKG